MLRQLNQSYPGGKRRLGLCTTGVLGSTIPSTGTSGPAWIYPSLQFPAANTREYAYWVESHTIPSDMPPDDTSAGTFAGLAGGVYAAAVAIEEWGVYVGAFPVLIEVGAVPGATAPGASSVIDVPDAQTEILTPQLPYLGGSPA